MPTCGRKEQLRVRRKSARKKNACATRLPLALLLAALLGCANHKLRLREWTNLPPAHYTIPPYARYLADFKIALDPGHGGLSHLPNYKRGPTGKEEAVMNLSVALKLKEFLEHAGAQVVMTRTDDRFVALAERAEIAAREKCDFMISLHHNASARPEANFTTVFYHLDPDYSPASMDLARAVYFGLMEALRLPETSPEGLLSDKLIYPAGFGLLRAARMPAILLESSFFSNAKEERRLMQAEYNRREAYGIFLGLARWAAGGVPSAKLIRPSTVSRTKTPEIVYALTDGVSERSPRTNSPLAIFSETASMKLNGEKVAARVDVSQKRLSFQPAGPLQNGAHLVQVDLQNLFKQNNLPRVDTILVASPTDSMRFFSPVQRLPADGVATLPIAIHLFDQDGEAVWEGTQVRARVERGTIIKIAAPLDSGRAMLYYQSGNTGGPLPLIVEADAHRDTFALELVPAGELRTLSGFVRDDSTKTPLRAVAIMLADSALAASDEHGYFFAPAILPGKKLFEARRRGYHKYAEPLSITAERSVFLDLRLRPILGGLLHSEHFILDAAGGGEQPGDSFGHEAAGALNLAWASALADTLRWAGAQVNMTRTSDTTFATNARIAHVNKLAQGWYLKLVYRKWEYDSTLAQCTIYPGNQAAERLANAVLASFAKFPRCGTLLQRNTNVPEVTLTNKTALEVLIKCREPQVAQRELPALYEALVRFIQEENRRAKADEPLAQ